MKEEIPKLDLPVNFIVGDNITSDLLNSYGRFPGKIKAGIFVLCMKGHIRATINLSEYDIGPNSFVALPPSSFLQIHEVVGEIQLYFAGFSSGFMESVNYIKSAMDFLPILVENPVVPLPEDVVSVYEDAFRLLLKAYALPNTSSNIDITRSVLNLFLQSTSELYKNFTQWRQLNMSRENEIYKEFVQSIMEHYVKEHSVSFYAKKLGITLPHLCATIKKVTGVTPMSIITNVIIMDAKAQLKSTDMSVKQIAYSLSFNNLSFFNKYFRQHVGMTPQEYRNS
ncbi:AraC family transcriptional regulator [Parabacteroides sp. AM08-6]|uniref:helix-turn-helix domain-containing protein n=1 Tax=Parabacteroides sp. AM08-6 TaxID=2292053 RepID=UPI000EFF422B|nr:helix-turn-helix domain-containing protein [Parabacteroides sp. AM08-6]RHJ78381.1 AraC family transcriptional regulator [Parabacteroides sp. AM08-6]